MFTFMFYFTAAFIFWTGVLCASHENLASSSSGTRVPTSSGRTDYHQAKKDYHTGLHVRVTEAMQHQNQQTSLDSRENLYPVRGHIERKIEKHQKELTNLRNGDKSPGPKNAQHHLSKQQSLNYRTNHPFIVYTEKPLTTKGDIYFHSYKANYHQDLLDRSMNAYTKQVAKGTIVPHENIDNDHQGMLPVARYFGRKVEKHKSQEMQIKSQSISSGPKNLQSIRTRKE